MLIVIFFFLESCFAFVILFAGAGLLRATEGLLGGLSGVLEVGLDGGWAGDFDFSGGPESAFEETLALTASFFFGLLEDSKATVACRSKPRGASVGGDGSRVLSALWLRSLDSLEEDRGVWTGLEDFGV